MILKYYIDKIADKLQLTDDTEKLFLREYVNKAIDEIFRLYPEKLYTEGTVVTVSGQNTINLPTDFWKPVAFNIDAIPMKKVNRWDFAKLIPDPADRSLAQPSIYDIMGVNTSGTSVSGAMEILSSSASDITQTFSVYGETTGGILANETINVSGTNAKALTNLYTKIYYAKLNEILVGTLSLRFVAGAAVVDTFIPNNLTQDFTDSSKVLWVYPWPGDTYTIRIKYYRKPPLLVNDGEFLNYLGNRFDDDIVIRGYIEWLFFDGQEDLAASMENRWTVYMERKIAIEKKLDKQDHQSSFAPDLGSVYPQFDPLNRR